jgi:hypothetical protein
VQSREGGAKTPLEKAAKKKNVMSTEGGKKF